MLKVLTILHKPLQDRTLIHSAFFIIFLFFSETICSQESGILDNQQIQELYEAATNKQDSFYADSINSINYWRIARRFDDEGNYNDALKNFKLSLQYRKKVFGEDDRRVASAYSTIGYTYKNLGRFNEAIENLKISEKIYKISDSDNYRLGVPYSNLGNVYKQKGNFTDALKYHQQALYHFGLGDTIRFKYTINEIRYNLAENLYLSKKLKESIKLILSCYEGSEYDQKATFLNLLGNIYTEQNKFSEAQRFFKQSIDVLRENAIDIHDSTNLADLYIDNSQFLITVNEFTEAERNLILAKPLIKDSVRGRDISGWYFTYGELYSHKEFDTNSLNNFRRTKLKNLNLALEYYQKAIIALSDNYTDPEPSSNPTIEQCKFPALTLEILQSKAKTYYEITSLEQDNEARKIAGLKNSLAAASLASDLLNDLRTGAVSEESKIVMTQLQNSIYLFTIKVTFDLYEHTGQLEYFEIAFQNSERNKAASLLDNLTDENARQASFIPDSLVQLEENINDQISFINQRLFEENQSHSPDSSKIERYQDQLFQLGHEKNDLARYLEENFRDYYQLKYTDDKITLPEIQGKLTNDEVLVEYTCDKTGGQETEGAMYIFFISKNDFGFSKLQLDSTYLKNVDVVYRFLAARDFINIPFEKYNSYIESAYGLYNLLIRPVEEKINNHSATIIPDGKLSYIPFDALLYQKPANTDRLDFKNLPYLIKKFTFNYSYSASLYLNWFNTEKRAREKLLAFAPEYGKYNYPGNPEFNQLAPLTGIAEEVESISGQIKSRLFLKDEATEENFMENYQAYDIIHLAMHAIMNDTMPMFSKLAFAPGDDSLQIFNGWLTTSEIYNLKLNARLSVLSACNTGSGNLREGEGVISLARGFFYAGCPSIIMTLWEVEDRSGADIMSEFYRLLKAGKKKHDALRLAKMKHIENATPVTAHPHMWLCYVPIGNTDAIYASNDFYFFIIILVILIVIIADQVVRHRRRKSHS